MKAVYEFYRCFIRGTLTPLPLVICHVSVSSRLLRTRSMYAMATSASSIPNKTKKVASYFTVPGGSIFKVLALTIKQDVNSPVKQNTDN
jgi:fumarate reductase subunit C